MLQWRLTSCLTGELALGVIPVEFELLGVSAGVENRLLHRLLSLCLVLIRDVVERRVLTEHGVIIVKSSVRLLRQCSTLLRRCEVVKLIHDGFLRGNRLQIVLLDELPGG